MIEGTEIRKWALAAAAIICGGVGSIQVLAAQSSAQAGHARGAASGGASAAQAKHSPAEAAYQQLNSGQVDAATSAFQAILTTDPNDAGALAGMGQVRMLQGNYLGAISFLERAKQASPNDVAIAAALDSARFSFLMGEGKDAQTAKDAEDAEKRYREALELRPGARQAVDALVNVLVLENKLGDAQDTLSTAVAHEASATGHPPAELELQLAQLDIANNQPQLAYPIFLQVLQDTPERVDAWSGMISALHLMGHDADAIAQEKVISPSTRMQLEATPGFAQMMTAMATAPAAPPAAGATAQPSYAPFVPSEAPVAATPVSQPASTATPATSAVATVPSITNPPRIMPPPSVRPSTPRPATAQPAPKTVVATPAPPPHPHTEAAQTSPAAPHHAASTAGAAPLVTQPASRPPGRVEDIPDTGDQQYPQPKAKPRTPAASGSDQTSSQ